MSLADLGKNVLPFNMRCYKNITKLTNIIKLINRRCLLPVNLYSQQVKWSGLGIHLYLTSLAQLHVCKDLYLAKSIECITFISNTKVISARFVSMCSVCVAYLWFTCA